MSEVTTDSHLYGALFQAVQDDGVFSDSKRFADAIPRLDPSDIEREFIDSRDDDDFTVREFIERYFIVPTDTDGRELIQHEDPSDSHVDFLWTHLREPQEQTNDYDTRIPLPHPHVIPGGRFREAYYWDSYFVAEGLAAGGRFDLVKETVENLASLLERFGHIPNGNRTYYPGRSQPPLFAKVLELHAEGAGLESALKYLPALEAEYQWWMDGAEVGTNPESIGDRVVTLEDGTLNRYWDAHDTPRPESYRKDREIARRVPPASRPTLYRNIRAACESGWDFSSRWLADPVSFETIHTTELLPVDLNACLWYVERRIANWLEEVGESERAEQYRRAAMRRKAAIDTYCWDPNHAYFFDYHFTKGTQSERWTMAGVAPLFFGLATASQADAVARHVRTRFLTPGGVLPTLIHSGQQWDAPNIWAPLQWMAVHGFRRYGYDRVADLIKERWLDMVLTVFEKEHVFYEKYNATVPSGEAVGGEYPPQYGFGWTNATVHTLQTEPRTSRRAHEVPVDAAPPQR